MHKKIKWIILHVVYMFSVSFSAVMAILTYAMLKGDPDFLTRYTYGLSDFPLAKWIFSSTFLISITITIFLGVRICRAKHFSHKKTAKDGA